MPKKNKESVHHRNFLNLDKRDKAFVVSHYHSGLHLQSRMGFSLKQIWIKGCESVLERLKEDNLPSGKKLCRHGYDKYNSWAQYEKAGTISCTLPTYDWAKDRRIQNSLINIKEYLYGWKDRNFEISFIAPVNTPTSKDIDYQLKVDAIRDIKGSLTLVRQVWKTLLVNGRKYTIRQAHWVSILAKGFSDVETPEGIEEIISSALHYAKEESAYELVTKQRKAKEEKANRTILPFDTTVLDAEHMHFSRALSINYQDDNAVEIEQDILSDMGEAQDRFKTIYTAPYSKDLELAFQKEVLDYSLRDSALTIGLTLLIDSNEDDIGIQIKTMLDSHSSTLFVLGIRHIVKEAEYDSVILTRWDKDHKKVTGRLVELLQLLQGIPTNERNAGVLDLLGIQHRMYTPDSNLQFEAEINQYGAMTTDDIYALQEAETIVEAIKMQDE